MEISLHEYFVSHDEKQHTLSSQEKLVLNDIYCDSIRELFQCSVERHTCVREVVYPLSPASWAGFVCLFDVH